jgi:hypothetical protein
MGEKKCPRGKYGRGGEWRVGEEEGRQEGEKEEWESGVRMDARRTDREPPLDLKPAGKRNVLVLVNLPPYRELGE